MPHGPPARRRVDGKLTENQKQGEECPSHFDRPQDRAAIWSKRSWWRPRERDDPVNEFSSSPKTLTRSGGNAVENESVTSLIFWRARLSPTALLAELLAVALRRETLQRTTSTDVQIPHSLPATVLLRGKR